MADCQRTVRPVPSLDSKSTRRPAHSRESSSEKNCSQPGSSIASPRVPAPHSRTVGGERVVDPKNAAAYGHHRQTSIVHGIQHSRNASLASATSSPLSPQLIAAAGTAASHERQDNSPHTASAPRPDAELAPPRSQQNMKGPVGSNGFPPERTSSAGDVALHGTVQRRLERRQSKHRRDHSHHPSAAPRNSKDDQKTVGEYALHVLFTSVCCVTLTPTRPPARTPFTLPNADVLQNTQFIAQAEEKLSECITVPFDPEPNIERICGPGVDPAFDQLIVALGHIASPKPKALIDSMMLWRKSKSDLATEARNQVQRSGPPGGPLTRRNTEPVQAGLPGSGPADPAPNAAAASAKQEYVAQAERRSTVSIYILCRVLMEVICQSDLQSITAEMEDKLESIIFGQLKIADPEQLVVSPLKLANWNLFSQLLGHMSEINFIPVTRRFIEDIESSLQDRINKSPTSATGGRDTDGKLELVLGGMKHLRMKIAPEDAWERSCDFLVSLGRLLSKSHGQRVKWAFCQVIDMLILPIASTASNSHLMHPKWSEALSAISPRLSQLFTKPRHWPVAFPLTATMLCASSPDTFSARWYQLVMSAQTKVKDRSTRPLCLQVFSRLLWTYLYRTNDSPQNATRKLDDILRLILPPPTKRGIVASDVSVTEPLIQIIRIIGFKYPEFCFRNVIFPLIGAELFASTKDLKVEQLDPDRIVVGIRAFLCIMSDLEKGEQGRPPLPQVYETSSVPERLPTSPAVGSTRFNISNVNSNSTDGAPSMRVAEENISRPVLTHVLTESVREYYVKFCEILGKITMICDNTFGGQAALDEKFGSPGPKTPMAETFNFSRRDEQQSASDQKQAFYELLHVAVQTLPRCFSADLPFNSLINLLCTGTAHVQSKIADSSSNSLKAIARHSHAGGVITGFSRFIFNFDDRYATMSDGGMLGLSHIENTLRLYVELLQIWIDEIRQKLKDSESGDAGMGATGKRALKLDLSSVQAEVEQAEAHGLFFLCSQSRRVRYHAITVLRLITEFDKAFSKDAAGEDTFRLIDILENDADQIINFNDDHLSVAERSRLQRGLKNSAYGSMGNKGAIVELCTSDGPYDSTLWFKIFPNLIRIAYEKCPFTVTMCRDLVCDRTLQMYKPIVFLSEPSRGPYYGADPNSARAAAHSPTAQPDVMIEQWKLYLIFACSTLADPSNTTFDASHTRKASKATSRDRTVTARMLFKYLIPLVSSSSASVRDAVVVAMGSVNIHIYRTLLEELQGQVSRCNDEARARIHQRTNSSPRRNRKIDLLRTEITHVFKLTSHFLKEPEIYQNDFFLTTLTAYNRDLKLFLMDGEVQMDWEFQRLRRHYCGLTEALFDCINRTGDPSRWMTFESRKSAFSLMEDWCGFSPNHNQIRAREDTMRQSVIDQQASAERGTVSAAMEIEKRNLRTAALSAMAALCGGPITVTTESGATLQFDVRRMLAWIEAIFNSGSDRMNLIGRRALQNLVMHNQEYPYLFKHCIARCYTSDNPKILESYFAVATQVIQDNPAYPCPFWKLLSLCLFALGNDQSDIRSKSSSFLRTLESRQNINSKIQDFDISIADKTQAVYKLAQFEISKRLAKQYTELAFHVFSEFTLYFRDLQTVAQRTMVAVVLPWVQSIELKLDPNGGPTAESYVLLANLLELTIKSSGALHNEVQALWQAVAAGPHPGNVRLVMDFVIQLCLERREQNFVEYAKQIVVFLSTTNSAPGARVIEFLLMQITPRGMVPNERRDVIPPPADISLYPYCADLSEVLPVGTKQAGFSLGQLAIILLVDLMVSPVQLAPENVPLLLQVATVLWDHYMPLVQDQAREMLVHLIHELVVARLDDQIPGARRESIEKLIDRVRRHDNSVVWGYEDSNGKVDDHDNKVPPSMEYLTTEIVRTFEPTFPGLKEQWSRLSLTWATSCPVRHLACRSFQVFRCILTSLDQHMLGDMLARLSNTIADEDPEIQSFSMEILTTLKALIVKLEPERLVTFPPLFWSTCACLESINEREFLEAAEMLDVWLTKVDFRSPHVRRILADGQPAQWEGPFEGLQPLVHKGLRSSLCWQPTLDLIDKLIQLPSDGLVGDDDRVLFAVLANFPRFLHELESGIPSEGALHTADILTQETERQGLESISIALSDYTAGAYRSTNDFLGQLFAAIKECYLPGQDFKMITFLIGLLTNSLSWVKVHTMRILCVALPEIDMSNPELAGHGSDLISPLLRLLQTEFCMEALEVLDNIMTMSGSHMDKHHLRMSMTRSTSKAIRKEYERTQSLFGIPEASGWATPVPAKKTEATRANLHATFYMCQGAEGTPPQSAPSVGLEFESDDFAYGYFESGSKERTATMLSDGGRDESGPIGDLVSKLDDLDDFFDEPSSPHTDDDRESSRTITEFTPESFESGAQLYDEQILPILHEASTSSGLFQNGFADRSFRDGASPSSNNSNTMNPGAFSAAIPPARPPLHARSITSPSTSAPYHTSDVTLEDDNCLPGVDEEAEDAELQPQPPLPQGLTPETIVRSPTPTQGPRPTLRRLKSRSRDVGGVPPVPSLPTERTI
ncbi:to cell morphogenesis protein PAG1 [Geosmithia morbida]|uniref:To cell morphogenesis protein PAG1 n=1 Tax=Geosmithia morbida TaxID=1094350 RepID=A0A9P4Z2N1_9HYPO|nr:to cell morphogenesis protein PAG1 [Geosmithia morbida]KAF4126595.1 to cell morphogenesis protein PAG1 [Geosmithia morbida]